MAASKAYREATDHAPSGSGGRDRRGADLPGGIAAARLRAPSGREGIRVDGAAGSSGSGTHRRRTIARPLQPDRSTGRARLRVLVVGDDAPTRAAYAEVVRGAASLELVGTARDPQEAARLAELGSPDVALVDAAMAEGGGATAVRAIGRCSPRTRVVAVSTGGDPDTVLPMLRAGVATCLDEDVRGEEVLHAIEHVGRGQSRVVPGLVREVTTRLADLDGIGDGRKRRVERVRRLIRGGDLGVVFQPIVELRDGKILAMEALSRIRARPSRSPDRWFTEAWEVGLGIDLELVALGEALAHLERLPAEMLMSVNASPRTIASPRFLAALEDVPASRVVVEVTEHAPVQDYDAFERAVRELRSCGSRLAMDDAGAGFSSLGHILRLAPELIKLDISVIRAIESDEAARATASALLRFASDIGAEMVAEGIETPTQLRALRSLGVEYGQGFYLERPAPLPLVGRVPTHLGLPSSEWDRSADPGGNRPRSAAVAEDEPRPPRAASPSGPSPRLRR